MASKVFNFKIEIAGIDQFLIQDVKVPEVEIGSVEHGATNYNIKTAGGVSYSDAELQKIVPADGGDKWAWGWLIEAQNTDTGTGKLPKDYYKDVIFKVCDPTGKAIETYLWEGCWVKKIGTSNFKRGNQSENVIETVTLSVNKVRRLS